MENYGLVSIVMPSYNCGQFIEESIHSVQAQTYQNWEIILVDDCSTDSTLSSVNALREKDSRIRYFRNKGNRGAAISRNRAIQEARGRWIAFLDSDDLWAPDKLEKQLRFMTENRYKFSYTCYTEINEAGSDMGVLVSGPSKITKAGMFAFCWPGCLTVIYDAKEIGLLQIEDIQKNNDYAMWLKICKKADCYLLPEVLARYRRGRKGSVSSHSIATMIKWHYMLFREAEIMGVMTSLWHAGINMVCGFYKKLKYVKRWEHANEMAI